eukprot:GHVL01015302.1.p2 GENE.GHVL01015302.1~~GHVL01015302.1.p2  ORF type:complete len:108 (+),score=32.89 GHVL01015302.1:142-465(+)
MNCGCRDQRYCLICKPDIIISEKNDIIEYIDKKILIYEYYKNNNKIYKKKIKYFDEEYFGVSVYLDFVSPDEESYIVKCIEDDPWSASQSGRKKQYIDAKNRIMDQA